MNQLTCAACQIRLGDDESFKAHYRTEWHSHNLKRKIVNLSPLTLQEYELKIDKSKNEQIPDKSENTTFRCQKCNKTFTSKSTYEDHINSKKHKKNLKSLEVEHNHMGRKEPLCIKEDESILEVEEVDSDEWSDDDNPTVENQCLFCSHESRNFHKNLKHMYSLHSFFIPDVEYCVDIKGLLMYLGEKVTKYYMCLWCNEKGRTFYSIDAAKNHMVDKGHCRMIFEGVALTEYVDFYDYSSSYPDAGNNIDKDDEISVDILDDSEFQLVLPSGVKVGHRSLLKYYKQNTARSSALVPSKNTRKLHKVLATYRALGWSQRDQEEAAREARDLHFLKRVRSKWYAKLGVKNNKLQKCSRQQFQY
ncbi:zinc finger protein 622 [Coccinella septempunctata]|uniref:zinc finger protein 622 n=1 Tax=Coccinella septempunctata TaxID=41139 RepID=UPI001D08791E|nr:zinc finger protein 622 [Coccinella septempunctata]